MVNFRDIVFSISTFSDVSEILPLYSWVRYGRKDMPFLLMGILFSISSVLKIYTLITAEYNINNMPAFHLLALVEINLLYCFYSYLIFKRIYRSGIVALTAIHLANTMLIQSVLTFNSLAWTFNILFLLIMGLFYFFKVYNDESDYRPLVQRPEFVITAGWLIYASGSLFTYLMGTAILSGKPEGFFNNAWIFQCLSNIAKNIIISYGLWLTRKTCRT